MKLLLSLMMLKFILLVEKKNLLHVLLKMYTLQRRTVKAEKLYNYLLQKDIELKRFDDSGQNVMYGVDFLYCRTNDSTKF